MFLWSPLINLKKKNPRNQKTHQQPLIKKNHDSLVWKESVPLFQKLYQAKKQKENIDDYQAVVLSLQKLPTVARLRWVKQHYHVSYFKNTVQVFDQKTFTGLDGNI